MCRHAQALALGKETVDTITRQHVALHDLASRLCALWQHTYKCMGAFAHTVWTEVGLAVMHDDASSWKLMFAAGLRCSRCLDPHSQHLSGHTKWGSAPVLVCSDFRWLILVLCIWCPTKHLIFVPSPVLCRNAVPHCRHSWAEPHLQCALINGRMYVRTASNNS